MKVIVTTKETVSHKIGKDEDTELINLLASASASTLEWVEAEILNKEVRGLIFSSLLTENERKVILARFGIIGGKQQSLSDISKDLNLSRVRIRQIELKAIRKLKASKEVKKMRSALDL